MNDIEVMEAFMRAMQKNAEKKTEREERIRKEAHEALLVRQAEAEKQRKEQERWDSLSEEEKKAELAESNKNNRQVVDEIKELCLNIIGKDIFRKEIGIVDGHNASSYLQKFFDTSKSKHISFITCFSSY